MSGPVDARETFLTALNKSLRDTVTSSQSFNIFSQVDNSIALTQTVIFYIFLHKVLFFFTVFVNDGIIHMGSKMYSTDYNLKKKFQYETPQDTTRMNRFSSLYNFQRCRTRQKINQTHFLNLIPLYSQYICHQCPICLTSISWTCFQNASVRLTVLYYDDHRSIIFFCNM